MFPIRTKNRKAISVVMTTLIILVASVVLGTGVVLYGTSLFQTGGQTQSISTQGIKMWVAANNTAGYSWGAAAIRNNGDVLVGVNTIQVRSVSIPFSNWYVDTNSSQVSPNFQASFISPGIAGTTGNMQNNAPAYQVATCPTLSFSSGLPNQLTINENVPADTLNQPYSNTMLCLQQASGPTSLKPGQQMIVYFRLPNAVLTSVDSGSAITLSILAGNVGGPATITVGNS